MGDVDAYLTPGGVVIGGGVELWRDVVWEGI